MQYRCCGKSGILLPAISLDYGIICDVDDVKVYRKFLHTAFNNGITHFDLVIITVRHRKRRSKFWEDITYRFKHHRDELIISTKAGYTMWSGPYGDWGSKKYLVSSLDQSLKRMKLIM